jgi:hypothetical protein
MNHKTRIALEGSIEKWEKIVMGTGKDEGCSNCPLCEEFWNYQCKDCPVRQATGQIYCRGTPYAKWADMQEEYVLPDGDWIAETPEQRMIAMNMLSFLRELHPDYQKHMETGHA